MFFERNAVFTIVTVAIRRQCLVPCPATRHCCWLYKTRRSALFIAFGVDSFFFFFFFFLLVLSVVFPTELLFEMLLTSLDRFFCFPLGMAQCLVVQQNQTRAPSFDI